MSLYDKTLRVKIYIIVVLGIVHEKFLQDFG